jgi:crossover junction endodeoxyribonuclease RuvC
MPATATTTVMGIDPGLAFLGLAVLEASPTARPRVLLLETVASTPKDGTDEERLDAIANRILDAIDKYTPAAIAYENQSGVTAGKERGGSGARSTSSSRRVHEVTGIARCAARLFELPCYVLAPSSVKLAVLGRGGGNASKARVKDAVRMLYGVPRCSEHAADAVAVAVAAARLHYMRALMGKRRTGRG